VEVVIDWRPIETATREESNGPILLCDPTGIMVVGHFSDELCMFVESWMGSEFDDATHWAPLTPPEGE
jgi:hypothetical protein